MGLVVAGMLTVSSADAASGGVEITNSDVTPFASKKVDNGLGVWEYGVKNKLTSKEAYSNLWHKTKTHGSAAQVGAQTPDRDCVKKDKTSYAKKSGKKSATAYTYWNTTCTNPR